MTIIKDVKISCDIGDQSVGGLIASVAQRSIAKDYTGRPYDTNSLEIAVHEAVRRVRTHLQVGITIHQAANGVVFISIHRPQPKVVSEPKINLVENVEPPNHGEELLSILESEEEFEEEDIPHHRKYWPIQSKTDEGQRWGRTPGSVRSWRRRRR